MVSTKAKSGSISKSINSFYDLETKATNIRRDIEEKFVKKFCEISRWGIAKRDSEGLVFPLLKGFVCSANLVKTNASDDKNNVRISGAHEYVYHVLDDNKKVVEEVLIKIKYSDWCFVSTILRGMKIDPKKYNCQDISYPEEIKMTISVGMLKQMQFVYDIEPDKNAIVALLEKAKIIPAKSPSEMKKAKQKKHYISRQSTIKHILTSFIVEFCDSPKFEEQYSLIKRIIEDTELMLLRDFWSMISYSGYNKIIKLSTRENIKSIKRNFPDEFIISYPQDEQRDKLKMLINFIRANYPEVWIKCKL